MKIMKIFSEKLAKSLTCPNVLGEDRMIWVGRRGGSVGGTA